MNTLNEETTVQAVVTSKTEAAEGVVFLTFAAVDGRDFDSWKPGAHIDLLLGNGLTRQYSLCGLPADRKTLTVGVLNAPNSRGGSKYVHESLNVGDELTLVGPRNHFELVDADEYLFIAGGIGITPILAMIREVESRNKSWTLTYGGRTLESMAAREELSQYGDRVIFWPQDTNGIINLAEVLGNPKPGTVVYTCGPEPLLAAVESICETSWPAGNLHLERFAPKVIENATNKAFEVEIKSTGEVLQVSTEQSTLDALTAAGIHVLSSCGEGTCGTCETGVLEGEVDHRDSVLTKEEQQANDCMMVCVSRANCARLVLDL